MNALINKESCNFCKTTLIADKSSEMENKNGYGQEGQAQQLNGATQFEETEEQIDPRLIEGIQSKIIAYSQKINDETARSKTFETYIPLRSKKNASLDVNKIDEVAELLFDVRKNFVERSLKVLLLTGKAGSGKTLFCRYLQNVLLAEWIEQQEQGFSEQQWLPILIDLSRFKSNPQDAIAATLAQELDLTQSEIEALQRLQAQNKGFGILFIFDGYDEIIEDEWLLQNMSYCLQNHFYSLINNKPGKLWSDAKMIVTCREENLYYCNQYELLFAPMDEETKKIDSAAFITRSIEPFSDEDTKGYLRKRLFQKQSSYLFGDSKAAPSSHSLEKDFEEMIKQYGLRDLIRVPSLLSITFEVLFDMSARSREEVVEILEDKLMKLREPTSQTSIGKPPLDTKAKSERLTLTREHLLNYFLVQSLSQAVFKYIELKNVKLTEKEELFKKAELRLQYHALFSSGYVINSQASQNEKAHSDIDELLGLTNFLIAKKGEEDLCRFEFQHKILQEFIVAKQMRQEIETVQTAKPDELAQLLISQKQLIIGSFIFNFLLESYQKNQIDSNNLLKLIEASRTQVKEESKINDFDPDRIQTQPLHKTTEENIPSPQQNPLAIAASNSITILNTSTTFHFKNMDLSKIQIPRADLSFGNFEETNFTKANLYGVNFTDASLACSNLSETNMAAVQFGVHPHFCLDSISSHVTFSNLGHHLLAVLPLEIVVFKRESPSHPYRKIGGFRQHSKEVTCASFSPDDKRVVSGGRDRFLYIWDTETMKYTNLFSGHRADILRCAFSPDGSKIVSLAADFNIIIWDIATNHSIGVINKLDGAQPGRKAWKSEDQTCEVGPDGYQILAANGVGSILMIWNRTTRRRLAQFRNRQKDIKCKYLMKGSQIVAQSSSDKFLVYDTVRGHLMKFFRKQSAYLSDGQLALIGSDEKVLSLDMASGKAILQFKDNTMNFASSPFAVSSDFKQIAFAKDKMLYVYNNFSKLQTQEKQSRDMNRLNLHGTIIDFAAKLSEENIQVFTQIGDYQSLEGCMQKILQSKLDHSEIIEVNLSNIPISDKRAEIIGRNLTWQNLQKLELRACNIQKSGAIALGNNISWRKLRILDLSENKIGDTGAEGLAKNKSWVNLEELLLRNNEIERNGGRAIGMNESWGKLKRLDLESNKIGSEGASAISKNPAWTSLVELNLSSNSIEANGITELSNNKTWSNLKVLVLSNAFLTTESCRNLSRNETWGQLEQLVLESCKIGDDGVAELCKNQSWSKLKILNLANNYFKSPNISSFTQNTCWTQLQELTLTGTAIANSGVTQLTLCKSWSNLKVLNLEKVSLDPAGFRELSQHAIWDNLEVINLSKNTIDVKAAEAFSKITIWKNLKALNLSNNSINDDIVAILCTNTSWVNLETLNLGLNVIKDQGVIYLSNKAPWTALKELDLQNNLISDEGIRALSQSKCFENLVDLNLAENTIHDEGASAIGKNQTWTNLKKLNLQGNLIGKPGAEALSNNATWQHLEYLNLQNNKLGRDGVFALSSNQTWTALKSLDLSWNKMEDDGARYLLKNYTWRELETLNVGHNSISVILKRSLQEKWPKLKNFYC